MREWRIAALAATASIASAAAWLWALWGLAIAAPWTVAASVAIAYPLFELRRNLVQNRRRDEDAILSTLGAGTALTLCRGLFAALLAGFLFSPQPEGALEWAPALLYLSVAVADFFDGYLARVRNEATKLGATLDVSFDAFGTLIAVALLVRHANLPGPFLLVGLLYYLFHGHMALRRRSSRPIFPLPWNPHRRMYAGFLFGYLAVALAPAIQPPLTVVGGWLFAAPVVAGFAFDWLTAVGMVSLGDRRLSEMRSIAARILYRHTPFVLRCATVLLGGLWLAAGLSVEHGWTVLLQSLGWPAPMAWATLLAIAAVASLGMVTAGWLGRLASLALVALTCLDVILRGNASSLALGLLSSAIGILLLGMGGGALWQPEDALLLRQAGTKSVRSHSEPAAA